MATLTVTKYLLATALVSISFMANAEPRDDQVRAAYASWNAAFNRADAKTLAAFYTGNASFLPATHDIIQGPGGVETFFSGLFASGVTDHTLDLITTMGDERILVAAAKWSAAGKDAAGKTTRFGGVATHVFERQPDGSLKLRLHTFN